MEDSNQVIDKIQVESAPTPPPSPGSIRRVTAEPPPARISIKSGPGDYYCSLINHVFKLSWTSESPSNRLLLIGEAKAPHKLTRNLVTSALGMNTYTIETRKLIQLTPRTNFQTFCARRCLYTIKCLQLVYITYPTIACCGSDKIYSTLVPKELQHGYITAAESYKLVHMYPGEPTAMYYLVLLEISITPSHDI